MRLTFDEVNNGFDGNKAIIHEMSLSPLSLSPSLALPEPPWNNEHKTMLISGYMPKYRKGVIMFNDIIC